MHQGWLCEVHEDAEGKAIVAKDKKENERVVMSISGHETQKVFDRYNIVSDQDLRDPAMKKQAYHEGQSKVVVPFKRAQNEWKISEWLQNGYTLRKRG